MDACGRGEEVPGNWVVKETGVPFRMEMLEFLDGAVKFNIQLSQDGNRSRIHLNYLEKSYSFVWYYVNLYRYQRPLNMGA